MRMVYIKVTHNIFAADQLFAIYYPISQSLFLYN